MTVPPSAAQPGPPAKPPRSSLTVRDMLFALLVLAGVVVVVGGLTQSCTFAPTGPTTDGSQLPVVDAPAQLTLLTPGADHPVRVPAVPPEWRSNAVDRDVFDGGSSVRAGWLVPGDGFVRLIQSSASEEALVAREARGRPVATLGPVDVDGRSWVAYAVADDTMWTTDLDDVRLLVLTRGDEAALRTLAAAVVAAPPVS